MTRRIGDMDRRTEELRLIRERRELEREIGTSFPRKPDAWRGYSVFQDIETIERIAVVYFKEQILTREGFEADSVRKEYFELILPVFDAITGGRGPEEILHRILSQLRDMMIFVATGEEAEIKITAIGGGVSLSKHWEESKVFKPIPPDKEYAGEFFEVDRPREINEKIRQQEELPPEKFAEVLENLVIKK